MLLCSCLISVFIVLPENLERIIDEGDCDDIDRGTSLKRLFIASNIQTLERMARAAGAGGNIASVHTRHGKQMAKSVPLGETYQDSIGLCRSRFASIPNEDARAGSLWRTSSMQNLISPQISISEDPREVRIQKPRMFIQKEQALPHTNMFSLPGSEWENGTHLQGSMNNNNVSYQERKPVLKTFTPRPPNLPSPLSSPPPLPIKTGRLNLFSSRDSNTETKAKAESVLAMALNASRMSKSGSSSSLPPPPPPLRPVLQNSSEPLKTSKTTQLSPHVQPALNSNSILQNDKKPHHPPASVAHSPLISSASQSVSKIPHLTPPPPPPPPPPPSPPPPPLFDSPPPFSVKSSSATQQSILKEDFSGRIPMAAQNSLLEEIQRKKELLATKDMDGVSEEEDSRISNNVCGQQSHKLPSQTLSVASTLSADGSLLSEIQMRRKKMELKAAAAGNHMQIEGAGHQLETNELYNNQMETSESSSNNQRPFLQDLLKALSNRTKPSNETTALSGTVSNRAPALHAASRLNEEDIPVQKVNLQPAHNRYKPSTPVFPPPAPPKFSSPVSPRMVESFPGVGKTQISHQHSKSIESLDFDLPPPPPPPPPTFDDLGFADLDDLPLPLPPPPEDFEMQSNDSFLQVLKSSPVPVTDCNTRQSIPPPSARNGTKGKRDVSCQPLHAWSVADVVLWLQTIELGEHANAFLDNSVDGAKLSQLNFIDWIQLGISDLDQRMKIVQARQKLVA